MPPKAMAGECREGLSEVCDCLSLGAERNPTAERSHYVIPVVSTISHNHLAIALYISIVPLIVLRQFVE
jgi:hypothetical protein